MRSWRAADLQPFARMNADPEVMEFFPSVLSRAESDALVERIGADVVKNNFGLWATEEIVSGTFIGFVGLAVPRFEASFTPCVEIGWRLARSHWGLGYATEAAIAVMTMGFEKHALDEIVSFTARMNSRSRSVMRKLGMRHDPRDDFEHPAIPKGERFREHVLYRMNRDAWQAEAKQRRTP